MPGQERARGERPAWLEATAIFLASRVVLWLVAGITLTRFSEHLDPGRVRWDDPLLHESGAWLDVWARWDSLWFIRIAEHGYRWPSSTPAFFPGEPLAIRGASLFTGGRPVLAGVLVSLLAGAGASVLLYRLADRLAGRAVARLTVLALALFPTSFFLGAVYSESLYLVVAIGSFWLAERGRLTAASLAAGAAILTRPQGIALLPALALLAHRSRGRRGVFGVVAPASALGALYPLTLWLWIGHPLAFLTGQDVWERHWSWAGPLGGIAAAVGGRDLPELGFATVMVGLAAVAWQRIGAPYGLYAVLAIALPMSFPSARLGGLYSFPRLALAAFPCFLAAGLLFASRRRLTAAVSLASATLLCVYVVRWSLWQWIA